MPVKVHALDHLVINVSNVARTVEWYQKILGMEVSLFDPGQGKPKRTSLLFGSQKINVRPKDTGRVVHRRPRGCRQRRSLLSHLEHAGRGGRSSQGPWRRDRGRSGRETGRPRHAALGLLPRSRRQFDRDFVLCGGSRLERDEFSLNRFAPRTPRPPAEANLIMV